MTHQFIINMMPFKAIRDSGEAWTELRALGGGDSCVGDGGGLLRFNFALKCGSWKVLLKIKIFEHMLGVWFINFQRILNLVFQALLVLLSHSLPALMPNNTVTAIAVFDLAFLSTLQNYLDSQCCICINKRQWESWELYQSTDESRAKASEPVTGVIKRIIFRI